MNIAFSDLSIPASGVVAVLATKGAELTGVAKELDKLTGGTLSRAIEADRFNGKEEQALNIVAPANTDLQRIILLGAGDKNTLALQNAGGLFARKAETQNFSEACVLIDDAEEAAQFAYGAQLGGYRFDKFYTRKELTPEVTLTQLTIGTADAKTAEATFAPLTAVAEGVNVARDLIWEPANGLNPESYAEYCKTLASEGLEVEVLGEDQMNELGMGALLGVGQGSMFESQLVVLKHNGGKPSEAPLAFVGKGVTFDTGGLSLKAPTAMDSMKQDMGGAAAVTGLMVALAKRQAKVNAIGILGLVENMPSQGAQRPGDVVNTMSGQTVEVLNTDAEGRLVLCDAMTYAQRTYKPKAMFDLATLTGAIVVALGEELAGIFSNNDELAAKVAQAGETEGEYVWRMPMGGYFKKRLKSNIADMRNNSNKGRQGGSGIAAQFLHNFIENDTPWVHIDIAGTAWTDEAFPTKPKGATGFGVRLLDRMVKECFEA